MCCCKMSNMRVVWGLHGNNKAVGSGVKVAAGRDVVVVDDAQIAKGF